MKQKPRIRMVVALLLAGLLLWRLIPRNIYSIAGTEQENIHRAYLSVHFWSGPEDSIYRILSEEMEEPQLEAFLELLAGKGYRPSLRNLIPWNIWNSSVMGDAISASVTLIWNQDPEEAFHFTMLGSPVSGQHLYSQGKTYYPADKEILTKLRDFAMEYGEPIQ